MIEELLFTRRWPKFSMAQDVAKMDISAYFQAYQSLSEQAPRRAFGQPYLGGRSGYPSTEGVTNRREEHFSIAMVNSQQNWLLPDGTVFELIDYQVPLKAKRSDRDIGKIDMFGLTEHGRAVLVELKVIGHSGGSSDPPPVALLEGLRYASIFEANLQRIADELRETFGRHMILERPDIVVLGEADWWSRWLQESTEVRTALEEKAQEISRALDLGIVFASVSNTEVLYGRRTLAPRFTQLPKIDYPVTLPKSALKQANGRRQGSENHESILQRTWWNYASGLHRDDLDGHERPGRPPVASLEKPFANLMLPRDKIMASAIKTEIAATERHKHFRSFRSSQAMAQSVFGAFKAAGAVDLLCRVPAECGRPAFGKTTYHTKMSMEVAVQTLCEPRPTQLDVSLETEDYRVAVECKFCETDFGECSRVRPSGNEIPICNGDYVKQQGRYTRCALSELGITYWDFIPELFDWNADADVTPCPLLPTYQIVRNVLGAVVRREGKVQPANGHAVFVYDGRNPAYKPGGTADVQLRRAAADCCVPGLIRRVTWQEIMKICRRRPELAWLLDAMKEKHGIHPSP